MKKGQINANKCQIFFKKIVNITKLKFRISENVLNFSQICTKQALKYIIFISIQKRPKMAKWPKHFFSGKQIQNRPNGNPAKSFTV
jgi:hypothetical protein